MVKSSEQAYVVAGYKSWNRRTFDDVISGYPGSWHFISTREELSLSSLKAINPAYVFFLHWSWMVPPEIVSQFVCVNFHMTDLPFGRGGSPLQNLILGGFNETKLTAFQMTDEMDAGPIFLKEELNLSGSAQEIYVRASDLSGQMIGRIISENPVPVAQEGEALLFKRRRPEQSEIPGQTDIGSLYDFIRMLDAEGYPRAFIEHDGYRFEFRDARRHDEKLSASVDITPLDSQAS